MLYYSHWANSFIARIFLVKHFNFQNVCAPVREMAISQLRPEADRALIKLRHFAGFSLSCLSAAFLVICFGLFFWGALFPRTADPIFHKSSCLHPFPPQGYVPRTFISISLCPPDLRRIRSRSSQQSVFGSANATDWATGTGLFLVVFLHLSQPSDPLFPDLGQKLTPMSDTILTQLLALFCSLDYTSKFSAPWL